MADSFFPVGERGPTFKATAVASKRPIDLKELLGPPILLLFCDAMTARMTREFMLPLREAYPELGELMIITIADLSIVPKFARGVTKGLMSSAFEQAAREIPAEYNAYDYLILIADWQGALGKGYKVPDLNGRLAFVLLDENGLVSATGVGKTLSADALKAINQLRSNPKN